VHVGGDHISPSVYYFNSCTFPSLTIPEFGDQMVDHNQHLQFCELISGAGMHSTAERHKCIGLRGNLEKKNEQKTLSD
jgi:hypothetical protein